MEKMSLYKKEIRKHILKYHCAKYKIIFLKLKPEEF